MPTPRPQHRLLGDVLSLRVRAPEASGLGVAAVANRLPVPLTGTAVNGLVLSQDTAL